MSAVLSYKFRLYPTTEEQELVLEQTLDGCRRLCTARLLDRRVDNFAINHLQNRLMKLLDLLLLPPELREVTLAVEIAMQQSKKQEEEARGFVHG